MAFKHVIFLFMLFSLNVSAENQQRLLPMDEAERDLSFVKFRQQIQLTVKNRDPEGFVQFVSQHIANSEGKRGIRHFVKYWVPEANDSELWPTMESILDMGGGFVRSERGVTFCAPYIFTNFPDDLDIYGHGAVIGEKVSMKAAPVHTSKTVATLSYDILKVEDWRSVEEVSESTMISWIKVSTLSGKKGYIDKKWVRSPTDYSACFLFSAKKGWKMVSLVSNE